MNGNKRLLIGRPVKRILIGMSGASGAILGIDLLRAIQLYPGYESHLVISQGAEKTILHETKYTFQEVLAMADVAYPIENIGASIASGTFRAEGMVVVPCSMKTLAGIACGYSDNLLLRAADVTIKEKRKLILVARESPLSPIHLKNMCTLSDYGATIMPPMLTYYNKPASIEDMNRHIIGKILNCFGLEVAGFNRWGETSCAMQSM